jgi:ATP-binding cassette subfamily B protein
MFKTFKKFFDFAGEQRGKLKKGITFAVVHSIFEASNCLHWRSC